MINNKYVWSSRSLKNIGTVCKQLQLLAHEIINVVPVDVCVLDNGGYRTAKEQNVLFQDGYSKCDGYRVKSYHQSGLAIDFVPIIDGKPTWANGIALYENAIVIMKAWEEKVKHTSLESNLHLHWGGFFGAVDLNKDGVLQIDEKLGWDMVHWELRSREQKNNYKLT